MFEEISKFLKEEYGVKKVDLTTNLKKDLGLSSFDFVNLICVVEDKYDVEIDEEQFRFIDTVGDFVEYMNSLTTA